MIDETVEKYINEIKKHVDVGFKFTGKGKSKVTHVNPKTKGLPTWVTVGKEVSTKLLTDLEADWEVYNSDGWKISNGFVTEQATDMTAQDNKAVDKFVTAYVSEIAKEVSKFVKDNDLPPRMNSFITRALKGKIR